MLFNLQKLIFLATVAYLHIQNSQNCEISESEPKRQSCALYRLSSGLKLTIKLHNAEEVTILMFSYCHFIKIQILAAISEMVLSRVDCIITDHVGVSLRCSQFVPYKTRSHICCNAH